MASQDNDIIFLFKILILGFDHGIRRLWTTINPESISNDVEILKGVTFGSKIYYIQLTDRKQPIGTKIFFCSFNPATVIPMLRKSYLRGANGIVLTFSPTDTKESMTETLYDLLEINKDSLPYISLIVSGEKSLYWKNEQFIKDELYKAASRIDLQNIEQLIAYNSVYAPEDLDISKKIINDVILEQINKLVIKIY